MNPSDLYAAAALAAVKAVGTDDEHSLLVARKQTAAVIDVVVTDLHAILFPERHPGYDPDHVFWDGKTVPTPEQFVRRSALERELFELHKHPGASDPAKDTENTVYDRIGVIEDELLDLPEPLDPDAVFEWSSSTIEWVADWAQRLLQYLPSQRAV